MVILQKFYVLLTKLQLYLGPIVCGMYVTFVLSPLLLPRLALIYYHRGRKTAHMIQVIKFPMEKREVLLETASIK